MKCTCLQQDEQTIKNHTEQFCGKVVNGFAYGCTGCKDCSGNDSKTCNNGCPVLNTPPKKQSDLPYRHHSSAKKSPSTKKTPSSSKKTPSKTPTNKTPSKTPTGINWWLWLSIIAVTLTALASVIIISRQAS